MSTEELKETRTRTIKFRFSVKVNIYLEPCIHIKSENVNIENEGAAGDKFWIFEILCFKMGKWMKNKPTSLHEIYPPPLMGQPLLLKSKKYFDLPPKPKIPQFQLLSLAGRGAYYALCSKYF